MPSYHGYNGGGRFFGQGRIQRMVPYRGGYRFFLDGWRYPFFVPYDRFRLYPFRVGLFVRFGAFYDPLGFYSIYDYGYPYPPSPYYAYGPTYSDSYSYNRNELRGYVESIDVGRGEVVVDDDNSRQAVTVLIPRDRGLGDIRVGDYVDVSGVWNRTLFDASRIDRIESRR